MPDITSLYIPIINKKSSPIILYGDDEDNYATINIGYTYYKTISQVKIRVIGVNSGKILFESNTTSATSDGELEVGETNNNLTIRVVSNNSIMVRFPNTEQIFKKLQYYKIQIAVRADSNELWSPWSAYAIAKCMADWDYSLEVGEYAAADDIDAIYTNMYIGSYVSNDLNIEF